MATNRAAQELEALLSMSAPVAAPDSQAELAAVERSRPKTVAGEAGFSTPEAVVTAVASSFILGPIGGLLLGAAQGMLGKREEQGKLDALAAEANALAEADEIVAATFDQQRASLTNPQDVQQLDTIEAQYTAARKLLQSPFTETRQKGMALMGAALEAQRGFDIRQEEQAIATQQREDAALRAMGQEGYTRFKDSRDNFMKESAPYLEVRNATVNLIGALERGTATDQYAAIKLLEKALDPTSVVRPEEQEAWGALGSALDRGSIFIERLKSGKTLTADQVRDIKNLAIGIEAQSYEMQQQRESRYFDEITDIELPAKYHDNFRIASPLSIAPTPAPTDPAPSPGSDDTSAADVAAAVGVAGKQVIDAVPAEVKTGLAAAGGLTAVKWLPRLTKLAGVYGLPVALAMLADELAPLEPGFDETATRAKFGLPQRPTN